MRARNFAASASNTAIPKGSTPHSEHRVCGVDRFLGSLTATPLPSY